MSYTHTTKHKKKYKYDKFEVTIPDLIPMFEKIVAEWVDEENKRRLERIAELKSPMRSWDITKKKPKQEIKDDLQTLKNYWNDDYCPVTKEDFNKARYYHDDRQEHRILIRSDGSFEFTIKSEMTLVDKMKGFADKKKAKEES